MTGTDIIRQQALDKIAETKALLANLVVLQSDLFRLDMYKTAVDLNSSILIMADEIAALIQEQAEADRVNRGAA